MANTQATRKAAKAAVATVKRAAIYVRVSSEKQADKISPEAQEADCRALAERQGYIVVEVYADTHKYRVGKRMVEPSGPRADRPQLRRMLADAREGKFDVILAWREDRLYRGYRPMLDVLETIEETGVEIELAKETFDKRMMGGKVWVAKMELDAKHDRFMMGVSGRLAQGKAWNNNTPYGYQVIDEFYAINDDEARWVKLIWQWYAEGVRIAEIRRRLIAGEAKQRQAARYKWPWALHYIRKILGCEYYYTGGIQVTWDGNSFVLPAPVIVDAKTAALVNERLARYKAYPAGNIKADTLAAGVVYCEACNAKMLVVTNTTRGHHYTRYSCQNLRSRRNKVPGCAKYVVISRIDAEVWDKLWELISVPGKLEKAIEQRVAELQVQEVDASAECKRLQVRLDDLVMKRQEAIALHQDKVITKADLELRLTSLSFEQTEAERELREKSLLVGNRAERLLEVARVYRENVLSGAVDVTKEPESEAEAARLFQFKKTMIQGLVTRVDVRADKSVKVKTVFDFGKMLEGDDLRISDITTRRRTGCGCWSGDSNPESWQEIVSWIGCAEGLPTSSTHGRI